MNTYKKILTALVFAIALFCGSNATAQKKDKAVLIKNAVDSQHYTFYAQYARPLGMQERYLTSEYTIVITKEKVEAFLPYFGRAYTAPIGNSDGGIKFTSSSFDYVSTPRKKGGWEISIKIKDVNEVQQLSLTIYNNGSATANVISTNRDPIAFTGEVRKK